MTLSPNTQITQENVGLPIMTVTLVRSEVTGTMCIRHWTADVDFEPGEHVLVPLCRAMDAFTPPECVKESAENEHVSATCKQSLQVDRPALSPPAEGGGSDPVYADGGVSMPDDLCIFTATPTPAPVDWERVGPKLVEAVVGLKRAFGDPMTRRALGGHNERQQAAILSASAALAAAQPGAE